ncbi:hypothetical protein FRC17_006433, partial [Serendipita sp. 399]
MAFSGLDAQAAKIADPSTDINVKLGIVKELSKTFSSEGQRDPEWQRATTTIFPILLDTLKSGHPIWKRQVNDKENVEHVLRMQILELLHKLMSLDCMRPQLANLAPLLLEVIRIDNEEMGILAMKMFNELFRAARSLIENHSSSFVQLTIEAFNATHEALDDLFSSTGAAMVEPDRAVLPKAITSLKLLADAPLSCLYILQNPSPAVSQFLSNQSMTEAALKIFVYQAPQEKEFDPDQMEEDITQYGPPASIVNQAVFNDLITAQVKICETVPAAAIRILRFMSPEAYSIRKEAVTVLRHLAITELKSAFAPLMGELLDERMLVGNLRSEPMLMSAVTMILTEVIQHTRGYMDFLVMMKVLRFGCLRLSDSSAPQGIVSTGSRTVVYILEALSVKVRPTEVPIPQEISTKLNALLHAMLEMMCTRLQCSVTIGERLVALKDGTASEELKQMVTLEQSRTIPVLGYLAAENYEHFLAEERLFLRGIPTIVKFGLQIIRTLNGRVPDADVMGRLFKSLCLAIPILRGDPQSETHIYKQTMEMFVEMEPH